MAELLHLLFPVFQSNFSFFTLFALLAALGLSLGFLTGFFGIGGGFLAVPIMNILLGIPYEIAVGSDVCFIIGTSSSGFIRHRNLKNVDYAVMLNMAIGSTLGVILGDYLQDYFRLLIAGGDESKFTVIMHSLFLVLLAITLVNMLRAQNDPSKNLLTIINDSFRYQFLLVIMGFGVGILTGLMGIGGGVVLVPILVLVIGLPVEKATGTSLGIVLISAIVSTIKKGLAQDPKVSMMIVGALLASSVLGVQLGIQCVKGIDRNKFRRLFSIIVISSILLVLYDLVKVIRGMP